MLEELRQRRLALPQMMSKPSHDHERSRSHLAFDDELACEGNSASVGPSAANRRHGQHNVLRCASKGTQSRNHSSRCVCPSLAEAHRSCTTTSTLANGGGVCFSSRIHKQFPHPEGPLASDPIPPPDGEPVPTA